MNNKSRNNKSICEKSMKLVMNIVKVSYISMANMGFRTRATPPPARVMMAPSLGGYPRNLRSHELPPAVSYLMHNPAADTNNNMSSSSSSVVKDDQSVDREAWDFIKRVREKNMKDVSEIAELVLPPPPPRIMFR